MHSTWQYGSVTSNSPLPSKSGLSVQTDVQPNTTPCWPNEMERQFAEWTISSNLILEIIHMIIPGNNETTLEPIDNSLLKWFYQWSGQIRMWFHLLQWYEWLYFQFASQRIMNWSLVSQVEQRWQAPTLSALFSTAVRMCHSQIAMTRNDLLTEYVIYLSSCDLDIIVFIFHHWGDFHVANCLSDSVYEHIAYSILLWPVVQCIQMCRSDKLIRKRRFWMTLSEDGATYESWNASRSIPTASSSTNRENINSPSWTVPKTWMEKGKVRTSLTWYCTHRDFNYSIQGTQIRVLLSRQA
jgi:hypothetical protein